MTKSRNILNPRKEWTAEEDKLLTELYADRPAKEIAARLNCEIYVVYKRAQKLNLKKSAEFMSSYVSGQFQRGERRAPETQFKPGHKTWSKGLKIGSKGRSAETQFKPGTVPHNYLPVGHEKINTDGYLLRKVSQTGTQWERWKFVHRLVWEAANGPIPDGYVVAFIDQNKLNCSLDNLKLVSRQDHVYRLYNLPDELVQIIKLKGRLTKQINKRIRNEQNA